MEILSSVFTMIFSLIVLIVGIAAWASIFKKAGYPSWYWVLMIVPIVNLVWFLIFSFSKWPAKLSDDQASTLPQPGPTATNLPPNSGPVS